MTTANEIDYEDVFKFQRGQYGEMDVPTRFAAEIKALIEKAGSANKVDEHGSWDFGRAFDRKGRGQALNWDLYGVGHDIHTGGLLIVIQVRKFSREHKGWFGSVRKNYFLLGTNEDGTTFAHSVSASVVRSAINHNNNVVLAVQKWMFGTDYERVIRQGDMALVPVRSPKGEVLPGYETYVTIAKSHRLMAVEMRRTEDGQMYAKHPTMLHTPGTHPTIKGSGWFKLAEGKRAAYWKFAAPTID